MPKIILHHPDGTTVKYGLNGSVFTIGRAENNDIVLRDGSSSSSHAVLKLTECGDFAVTDLESTNHTKVNGQKVRIMTLMNGDVLQMGESRLVYESDVPTDGRVRDDQATQIYDQARPSPQMPVFVNQPPRSTMAASTGGGAAPLVVPAMQPYPVQRPISTTSYRRSSQNDGCFAIVVLCFVLPVVFFVGVTMRHYQDNKKEWFWDYLRQSWSEE